MRSLNKALPIADIIIVCLKYIFISHCFTLRDDFYVNLYETKLEYPIHKKNTKLSSENNSVFESKIYLVKLVSFVKSLKVFNVLDYIVLNI